MPQHLIFYDGNCGLCDRTVAFLLTKDRENKFVFAPLDGITAKEYKITDKIFPNEDTLILVEDFQTKPLFYSLGKAALRICWLLGGYWSPIGLLSFLPPIFYDWAYRLVARNRNYFFKQAICLNPRQFPGRFLP